MMAVKGVNRKKKAKSASVKAASKAQSAKISAPKSNIFKTYKTTKEIPVPKNMIDQIIGQDEAAEVVKKAARQRRHVLLIGDPGTGKSMLGMALAEMLPAKGNLEDSLCYPNSKDPNCPIIKSYPAGEGEKAIVTFRRTIESSVAARRIAFFLFGGITLFLIGYFLWNIFGNSQYGPLVLVSGLGNLIWIILLASMFMSRAPGIFKTLGGLAMAPKPLITHNKDEPAPFIDATGAHDGALLGDVLHDPLQSGGLGTPPHERVMPGMIHRAHLGVLFIDEIATLSPRSQQELLTALQEKKYPITGQSERSSGSMVRTEPVPCNFIMVAAGNMETLSHMHPALRSRIRGYGYEVHMKDTIPDTDENRWKIAQFVAQEVVKDGKIPHFSKDAVESIILESRKMASRKGHLTLIFRELGGLVRAAGDVAVEQDSNIVLPEHVEIGKRVARTLEKQIGERYIERKKQYEVIITHGEQIGRVNGLAVIGATSHSGIVLSIEAEVTPGGKKGRITATGKLGEIAKEAVINVSAIIKKYFGEDLKDSDIYVQFLQTYEGVEGDSASIAVATAVISALKGVPVKQDYAMTGSLSVRGEVLPVGGVSSKVEAAIDSGVKYVIVPESNLRDIVLTKDRFKKIKIIPVKRIEEVLKEVINWKGKEDVLKKLSRR